MKESPIVAQWKAEGRAEGKAEGALETMRKVLLDLLKWKFPEEVSADLIAAVEAEADLDRLSRWLKVIVLAPSSEAYRAAMAIGLDP